MTIPKKDDETTSTTGHHRDKSNSIRLKQYTRVPWNIPGDPIDDNYRQQKIDHPTTHKINRQMHSGPLKHLYENTIHQEWKHDESKRIFSKRIADPSMSQSRKHSSWTTSRTEKTAEMTKRTRRIKNRIPVCRHQLKKNNHRANNGCQCKDSNHRSGMIYAGTGIQLNNYLAPDVIKPNPTNPK